MMTGLVALIAFSASCQGPRIAVAAQLDGRGRVAEVTKR
jgi:hypothetical protein